jgi:hypothetical protein
MLDVLTGRKRDVEDLGAPGEAIEMVVDCEQPSRPGLEHLEATVAAQDRGIGDRDTVSGWLAIDQDR